MNPVEVVVASEDGKFSPQIDRVPEKRMVEELSSHCSDCPFDEGMRHGDAGDGLDFFSRAVPADGPATQKLPPSPTTTPSWRGSTTALPCESAASTK